MILLPRQARDKHREKLTKEMHFLTGKGVSFLTGEHLVNGEVVLEGGAREPLGGVPACIANGQPATCPDATTATTINPAHGGRDTAAAAAAAAAAEQPRVVSL
jgi:hypothetical protein